MMKPFLLPAFLTVLAGSLLAQTPEELAKATRDLPDSLTGGLGTQGSSPFDAPEKSDTVFVVDTGPGLDTGCTFRSGGPLVFDIMVDRYFGDIATLRANNLLPEFVLLQMPAFDVDINANVSGIAPELDEVYFNGNLVHEQYLTGDNQIWKLNTFRIPIDWVIFPDDPGAGSLVPEANTISIHIDVGNTSESWCVAIDWASIEILAPRPVVMAHGVLSNGGVWNDAWVPGLDSLGIPNSNALNMGDLDSISSNAGKISTEVDRVCDLWGVEKVVLVCHSKGGLDARHYAENSDKVSQVIQIGTPNAGSPLADWAQTASVVGLGVIPTLLVNTLATPAGYQLTTLYMGFYNSVHGRNPEVTYTAMAGNYDDACPTLNPFCRPLLRAGLGITGVGDSVVPLASVHALPYTTNRTHASSGTDLTAIHTRLHRSNNVFNKLVDLVKETGSSSSAPTGGSGPLAPGDDFVRTASSVGALTEGAFDTFTISVDQADDVMFALLYPSGDMTMSLQSPTGTTWDAASASGSSTVEYENGETLGGMMEVFYFETAEVGIWTVTVTANTVVTGPNPTAEAAYAAAVWYENPEVTFTASFEQDMVGNGENLVLMGTLMRNGSPFLGQTVTASAALPDDSTASVTLLDDGVAPDDTADDGIYTGTFSSTTQGGNYRFAFTASGALPGPQPGGTGFSRQVFGTAGVGTGNSTISGPFSDTGVDTNANSLFDELQVDVGLNIDNAGDYTLYGELQDSSNNLLVASISANLGSGAQTLTLSFDGATLFNNGVDGPYDLVTVQLIEEQGTSLVIVDSQTNAHTTTAYGYTQFEHAPLTLTGLGTDTGVDADADTDFDQLDITVEILVEVAATYNWSARLVDSNGTEIGFFAGSGALSQGLNNIDFSFDGTAIGANGVDGPYVVRDLLIFAGSTSLVAGIFYTTQGFLASQFNGWVPPPPPIGSGAGVNIFTGSNCSVTGDPQATPWAFLALAGSLVGLAWLARRSTRR